MSKIPIDQDDLAIQQFKADFRYLPDMSAQGRIDDLEGRLADADYDNKALLAEIDKFKKQERARDEWCGKLRKAWKDIQNTACWNDMDYLLTHNDLA